MRNIDTLEAAGSGRSSAPLAPTSCITAAQSAPESHKPRVIRVAILGAGVAGLTTALALSRLPPVPGVRLDIEIFDQARELREIGASIALQPCALRVLEKLGLGKEVEELAYRYGEHPLVSIIPSGCCIGPPMARSACRSCRRADCANHRLDTLNPGYSG